MTIKELKQLIKNYPDDMIVVTQLNKNETNGMLRLLEVQGRDLENAVRTVERDGALDPKAEEILRRLKVDMVNWNQKLLEVRGWNHA